MHLTPSPSPDSAASGQPKRNWPLIGVSVAVGLAIAAVVLGLVALWVTNFNLLEWME